MCEEYKLHRETYFLSVDMYDRFMEARTGVQNEQLQLIGITCLFIASKIEVSSLPGCITSAINPKYHTKPSYHKLIQYLFHTCMYINIHFEYIHDFAHMHMHTSIVYKYTERIHVSFR